MNDDKIALSQAAIDRMKEELDSLLHDQKPRLIERVSAARAHGDLSENADYHAAREELAKLEGRIRELQARLKRAIAVDAADDGVVAPGKIVELQMDGGQSRRFVIGAREEKFAIDGLAEEDGIGFLSASSPLGAACLGKRAGDLVEYVAPSGTKQARIIEVRPLPAQGD
jgi:transcription elongation factor GreA